jgi:hypothetical protein
MLIRRAVAALAALSLVVSPIAAEAAKKRPGKKPTTVSAPAAPPPEVLKPIALAAPTLPASLTPRKRTDLEDLAKKKAKERYDESQAKFLNAYDITGDRREAFAVDKSLLVTPAPRMEQYMQLLADELMHCWSGSRPPVKILVVATAAPSLRAYGSGVIEISTGTIKSAQNTDVLAFMLAHEMAHILKQDEARRNELVDMLLAAVNLGSSGMVYANEIVVQKKGGNGPRISFRQEFGSSGMLVAGYAGETLVSDVFRQLMAAQQEFGADRLALDLVVCTRRDPDMGYNQGMGILHQSESMPLDKVRWAARLVASEIARELLDAKAKDSTVVKLVKMLGVVGSQGALDQIAKAIEKLVENKISPAERIKELDEYAKKVYGGIPDLDDTEDAMFDSLRRERSWTELTKVVDGNDLLARKFAEAGAQRQPGTLPQIALADLQPALATFHTDPRLPESYRMAAVVASIRGDTAGGRAMMTQGADMSWATRDHLLANGVMQARAGDAAGLARTIAHAKARMGNVPQVLPLQVWEAVVLNKPAEIEKLSAQCLIKGGLELYSTCTWPLGYDPMCAPKTDEGKEALKAAAAQEKAKVMLSLSSVLGIKKQFDANARCAAAQAQVEQLAALSQRQQ